MPLPFSPQQGSSVDLPPLPDPQVSGTPSGMPPGLPPAPEGLPFSPGPAPRQPVGMDLTAMVRQQLMQPPPPRQWGQTEGIGNILQSIGSGMMGQVPNWQAREQAANEQQQRGMQMALQLQQIEQSGQHMDQQNRLLAQQAQEYGWKTMDRVSKFYPFVPDEQKESFLNEWRGVIKDQFTTGLKGDPAGSSLASNDRFIDHMITSGQEKGQAFVSSYPFLPPAQKTLVAQMAQDDPKKAMDTAKELAKQAILPILSSVGERVNAWRTRNPKFDNQNITLDDALTAAGASPRERQAVDWWMSDEKQETITSTLRRFGVTAPSTIAKVEEAEATELIKQGTPGGQATIESSRASAAKTRAEIPFVGVRQVPGQGGMLVQLAPGAGGGAATDPKVLQRTELPGLTVNAAQEINTQERISARLRSVVKLTKTGDLDNYIGPALTGARFNEWGKKNLPDWLVGKVPNGLALLDQVESDLKNLQIRDITKASVRESEEPRILATVPNRLLDKPEMYRAKLMHQVEVQKVIELRTKDLLGPDGRMKTNVDPEDVARRYPMPEFGDQTNKPQVPNLKDEYKKGGVKLRGNFAD